MVLVIAHHPLAHAFSQLAAHVFQFDSLDQSGLLCVDVVADLAPRSVVCQVLERLAAMQTAEELLILTDLPGATPSRIAQSVQQLWRWPSRVVTGVNAAMLVTAVQRRGSISLPALEAAVMRSGQASIQGGAVDGWQTGPATVW